MKTQNTYLVLLTFLVLIVSNFQVASNPNNTFVSELISYYPLNQGSLQDVINTNHSLTYNDTTTNQQSNRLGLQNEAIQVNQTLNWAGNQPVNLNKGMTIFFRYQEDTQSDERYTIFYLNYTSGSESSGIGWSNGQNSNQSELIWHSEAITIHESHSQVIRIKPYKDGVIHGNGYGYQRFLDGDLFISNIKFGKDNMTSQFAIDDLAFFDRVLTDEEISQLHGLSQDINAPVPDQCEENLKDLYSKNVTVDYEFINSEHRYSINLGGFTLIEDCYQANIYLNGDVLTLGVDPHRNSISTYFPNHIAEFLGCVKTSEQELECHFQLEILYQGKVQMTKNFTSIMTTTNLDDIQNGLQLSVISDHSDLVRTIGSSVETEVNICTDATCLEYSTTGQIIRNEISFIELKINTPQYQSFFPVHKSLKLDSKEFLPENLEEIQNWNQPGKIIYQIKPHIASDDLYLLVQIGLVETLPTTRRMRRFLQQEQQSIEIQDELGANDQDLVGKQIVINIIDKFDSKEGDSENSNTGLILGVTLGSVAFVSFSVSVVAFTILKMKKLAILAEAAKVAPVPNCTQPADISKLSTSFPNTIRPLQGLPENA